MILEPPGSEIAHERIFQQASVCLPKIWGEQYPASEVLDDMENSRGLSLLQACQRLKLLVRNNLVIASNAGTVSAADNKVLLQMIEEVGSVRVLQYTMIQLVDERGEQEYFDVLHLAKSVSKSNGRRVIWTLYHAALEYHAVKVLYSCMDSEDPFPNCLDKTISDMLAIAYKAVEEDTHQQYRLAPALSVALLKTRDNIHRSWIQSRIERAEALFSKFSAVPIPTWPDNSDTYGFLPIDSANV